MSDEGGARLISTRKASFSPEQVQERLERLARIANFNNAQLGRINLMFEVLDGIAKGSVNDPMGTAAAVVKGVEQDTLKSQNGLKGRLVVPISNARLRAFDKLEEVDSEAYLFNIAVRMRNCIAIEKSALNRLFNNSRCSPSSRVVWERDVRTATYLDHITRLFHLFSKGRQLGIIEDLIHQNGTSDAFEKLKSSKGTLLLTFHGGFATIASKLLARMKIAESHASQILVDPRGALFTSLRALEDGRVLVMSPDGACGRKSVTLSVLGKNRPAASGAAFLAYASSCNTAWYTVVREGEHFKAIIKPGPSRSEGETFDEFSDRLYRFYSERIEAVLTGDPRSIVLRPSWIRTLK